MIKIGLFLIRLKNGGSDSTPRILTLILNQFYLIIGSKNVHLIIGKPGDLEFYKESRFHVSQILKRIKGLLRFFVTIARDLWPYLFILELKKARLFNLL